MLESSLGPVAPALFSSNGARFIMRAGDSMPGLGDLACSPAAPASPAWELLLLALRGVGLVRGADAGPASTDLPGCGDRSPAS